MKRYLYEIREVHNGKSYEPGWYIPWMPKVLAEKTAKQYNKALQKEPGRKMWSKYKAVKAMLYDVTVGPPFKTIGRLTKDGTPHNYRDLYSYQNNSKGEK